jgi:hypothetical protein
MERDLRVASHDQINIRVACCQSLLQANHDRQGWIVSRLRGSRDRQAYVQGVLCGFRIRSLNLRDQALWYMTNGVLSKLIRHKNDSFYNEEQFCNKLKESDDENEI